MAPVDREAVEALVERISASGGFSQSERLCRFLRYTVSAALDGRAAEIKEYSLGREVFDRKDDFDPRLDPIVRVEARRLRKKLDEYYAGPGAGEPVRLRYPKGSYAPVLESPGDVPSPGNSTRRWIALGSVTAAGIFTALWLGRSQVRANLLVLPARWVWKSDEFTQTPLDVDLAERIAAELATRHQAPVVDWPAMQAAGVQHATMREAAAKLGAVNVLVVAVRMEPAGARLTVYLIDPFRDRKLHVFDREALALTTPESRREITARISLDINLVIAKI